MPFLLIIEEEPDLYIFDYNELTIDIIDKRVNNEVAWLVELTQVGSLTSSSIFMSPLKFYHLLINGDLYELNKVNHKLASLSLAILS